MDPEAVIFGGSDGCGDRYCDPERIVDMVADEDARALFRAASTPKTVEALAECCSLPLSTAYRKVGTLEEAGLLRRRPPRGANGTPPRTYERAVDDVTVTLGDGLVVECSSREDD